MNRLSVTSVFVCVLTLVILTALTSCANKSENSNATPADALTGTEVSPSIEWQTIQSGTFLFGSTEDTPCRAPIMEIETTVKLSHSFMMAATEITQAQWKALDLPNPSKDIKDDKPVTFVNFYEALVWCNKLSILEELDPCYDLSSCASEFGNGCNQGYEADTHSCRDADYNYNCLGNIYKYSNPYDCPGYRLPTTAEWEYAAKAGTTEHTYNGDVHYVPLGYCEEEPALEDIAWYCNNSGGEYHPVKHKQPNPWGFYDILGNVYEWVDYWADGQSLNQLNTQPDSALNDPIGPSSGRGKDIRGGKFDEEGCYTRAARQFGTKPYARRYDTGFRPVRTVFEDSGSQGGSE